MAAQYFLGKRSFTSKKGTDCFIVTILFHGSNGWASQDKFISSEVYASLTGFEAGASVRVSVDLSGNVVGVSSDDQYSPIALDCKY